MTLPGRSRLAWFAFLLLVLFILLTLPVGRPLVNTLVRTGWMPFLEGGLAALTVVLGTGSLWHRRSRLDAVSAGMLAAAAAVLLAAATSVDLPGERLHFVQYGLLGVFAYHGLVEGRSSLRAGLTGWLLVAAVGWADEGIQYLLPGRVYDLRDMSMNAFGGLLGILVAAAWPQRPQTTSAPVRGSWFLVSGLIVLTVAGPPTSASAVRTARSWPTMGTYAEAVVETDHGTAGHRAVEAVRTAFDRVDRTLSLYRKESDLRRLNRAAGRGFVTVDPWVARVVKHGRKAVRVTGGAFSMNVLRDAVGRGLKPARLLDRTPPGKAGEGIRVAEDPPRVALGRPGMALDAGGIAKGFALDRAADAIREMGVSRFLLRLGRSVMAGKPPSRDTGGWPVDLPGERGVRRVAYQSIAVSRQPADTVGTHLLDPRTGRPVPAGRWVLVSARTGWVADMASTALVVEPALIRRLMGAYPSIRWSRRGTASSS